MCEVLDRVEARGIKKGMEKGMKKGLEKGITQGEINKGLRVYMNMRKEGISKKKAKEMAEITPKLVREAEALLNA